MGNIVNLLENNRKAHNHPAQNAPDANANRDVGLDHKECCGAPEENLEAVKNGVRFQTSPSLEGSHVVGKDLIADKDKRFGTLNFIKGQHTTLGLF